MVGLQKEHQIWTFGSLCADAKAQCFSSELFLS
jgi:hypothetical protein